MSNFSARGPGPVHVSHLGLVQRSPVPKRVAYAGHKDSWPVILELFSQCPGQLSEEAHLAAWQGWQGRASAAAAR